jgi:predicted XRE-type DNA-binding protein
MNTPKLMRRASAAPRANAPKRRGRIGSSFDDLLRETSDRGAVKSKAIKRVLAWQISEAMRKDGLTKAEMAERMSTSRSQLDRLLDPANDDVMLSTLARAAETLGREIRLELA